MKLLLDMNLSPRWVSYLEAHGFIAVHWSSVGAASAPDRDLMTCAGAEHFVIVTQDLDFGSSLATSGHDGPSVVQLPSDDLAPEAIGAQIVSALVTMASELERGALITVKPERTRLRLLPINAEQ